eukprot:TRINITY_DN34048_c1_g1_i1.p1 TRINITY_DN34048_c1_g1~~TRINITY_DN34048_c1_g1_i1.p1  ORF type:complete len:574 (-),score=135.68 TRINITY_DN34048_c1_g1_i1:57-1778(-)
MALLEPLSKAANAVAGICTPCFAAVLKKEPNSRTLLQEMDSTETFSRGSKAKSSSKWSAPSEAVGAHQLIFRSAKNSQKRKFKDFYTAECEKLGEGGFGQVYRSVHKPTGAARAVKLIRKGDEGFEPQRVLVELECLMELDHPHICRLYEWFEDENNVFIVTELIQGEDLRHFMQDEDLQSLFRQLLEAVAYCHDRGVAHRDLKMQNCMVWEGSKDKVLKVIDFGIAAVKKKSDKGEEWMQEAVGTPIYMSPSMVDFNRRRGIRYGYKCDIWAAGVLLFTLLTREHPFLEDMRLAANQDILFKRILYAPLREDLLMRQGASVAEKDLICKMLTRDADARPNAIELLKSDPWLRKGSEYHSPLRVWKHLTWAKVYSSEADHYDKAVLCLLARHADIQELSGLRRTFRHVDTSLNGVITVDEMGKAFMQSGIQLQKEDLLALVAAIDADGSGSVSFTEFLAATLEPRLICSDEAARVVESALCCAGQPGSRSVSGQDIERLCGKRAAAQALEKWDKNHDGRLCEADIKHQLNHIARRRREAVAQPPANMVGRNESMDTDSSTPFSGWLRSLSGRS